MNINSGINKVFLVGEISRQPRWHKNGQDGAVLCCTLTTKETYNQHGQPVEHKEEHVLKISEHNLKEDLKLGQLLHVEGKIKTTSFTDDQSVKRYKTEVIVVKLNVLR